MIWRTCNRSARFATISRSGRILRSVFFAGDRSSYDWSYAWSRDQQRLEKIDDKIHHNVGNRTTSASHKRSIVPSIVAPPIDRTINRGILHEQSNGGATDRNVARPVARLIVRPLTIWNSRFQVLNMAIDLVATDLPLALTHDLCDQSYDLFDQSYVLSSICPRLQHFSIASRSSPGRKPGVTGF